MRRAEGALPLRHAVVLGALQGPAELLPVSSSAHTALVPWLADWPYTRLDAELRKSFEVALHAGAGCALAIAMRRELLGEIAVAQRTRAATLALSALPPAIAGRAFGGLIERRLGGPRSIAWALVAGAVTLAVADAKAPASARSAEDARACDGLALGVAQAAALVPGVSRSGATLTAARARGFSRAAAQSLSWTVAMPVILGATALQGRRLARASPPPAVRLAMAVGAASAFASTLVSARLLRGARAQERPLLPYSLYRCLLAALVVRRLRRAQ
jgi:undecaprenyl-diphosphatase